jgi:hypothetical protein
MPSTPICSPSSMLIFCFMDTFRRGKVISLLPHGECGTMEQSELTPCAIPYFCRFCGKRIKTMA